MLCACSHEWLDFQGKFLANWDSENSASNCDFHLPLTFNIFATISLVYLAATSLCGHYDSHPRLALGHHPHTLPNTAVFPLPTLICPPTPTAHPFPSVSLPSLHTSNSFFAPTWAWLWLTDLQWRWSRRSPRSSKTNKLHFSYHLCRRLWGPRSWAKSQRWKEVWRSGSFVWRGQWQHSTPQRWQHERASPQKAVDRVENRLGARSDSSRSPPCLKSSHQRNLHTDVNPPATSHEYERPNVLRLV